MVLYSDCAQGKWGLDCLKPCDSSCSGSCNKETGECVKLGIHARVVSFNRTANYVFTGKTKHELS